MSQFGNLKHIVDLETLLGYRLSLIDFTSITTEAINYSWGDETELINWIRFKDQKDQYNGNFYTISGSDKNAIENKKKYPLIWLVTPVTAQNQGDIKRFNGVKLIFCSNTTEEWLNSTRWSKHIPMLQGLTDKTIEKLVGGVSIVRERGVLQYSYKTIPKYAVSDNGGSGDESKTLDLWDAVVLEPDLLVNDSCRDEAYFEFCNK